MNIVTPSGDVYAIVYLEKGMLCICPARYDFKFSVMIDQKAIPQLINILQELQSHNG